MRIGYARVRADPRDADTQRAALATYRLDGFFADIGRSGTGWTSTELGAAFEAAQPGGQLVITKLSRLARTLTELADVLTKLADAGVLLQLGPSLFDLRKPDHLLTSVIAAAADFEADIATQRATQGWRTARSAGRLPGRKRTLTAELQSQVVEQYRSGESAALLAERFDVGRSTIYRIVDRPAESAQ